MPYCVPYWKKKVSCSYSFTPVNQSDPAQVVANINMIATMANMINVVAGVLLIANLC